MDGNRIEYELLINKVTDYRIKLIVLDEDLYKLILPTGDILFANRILGIYDYKMLGKIASDGFVDISDISIDHLIFYINNEIYVYYDGKCKYKCECKDHTRSMGYNSAYFRMLSLIKGRLALCTPDNSKNYIVYMRGQNLSNEKFIDTYFIGDYFVLEQKEKIWIYDLDCNFVGFMHELIRIFARHCYFNDYQDYIDYYNECSHEISYKEYKNLKINRAQDSLFRETKEIISPLIRYVGKVENCLYLLDKNLKPIYEVEKTACQLDNTNSLAVVIKGNVYLIDIISGKGKKWNNYINFELCCKFNYEYTHYILKNKNGKYIFLNKKIIPPIKDDIDKFLILNQECGNSQLLVFICNNELSCYVFNENDGKVKTINVLGMYETLHTDYKINYFEEDDEVVEIFFKNNNNVKGIEQFKDEIFEFY